MAGTGLELEFKTMACRAMHRLSAVRVANLKEPGRYADGGGLYLFIDHSRRRWVFRYSWRAIRREIGLGSARTVPLAKAREKAALYRELLDYRDSPARSIGCQMLITGSMRPLGPVSVSKSSV